ncbi:hypothetical protein A3Q56_03030 [Intoshia linei]|uniref:Uncharacterized protein n=1 Tax=Intoshia linei TaxID=1819745 RepID=A0A177B4L2_9BILA|nr:hypothetical protein A3Q56_03030 [Intoshia linei]
MNHKEYLTNDVINVKNASFVNDPAERAVMKFKKAITIYDIEDERKKIVSIMNVFNNNDLLYCKCIIIKLFLENFPKFLMSSCGLNP